MRIGLIINPMAGLGGPVGLKASDGAEVQRQARRLGAEPEAGQRTAAALTKLGRFVNRLEVLTYPAELGEYVAQAGGFESWLIGEIQTCLTASAGTRRAVATYLGFGKTLMGVDVAADGAVVAEDAAEAEILTLLGWLSDRPESL